MRYLKMMLLLAYCLTLYLTPLLTANKFRNRWNKDGAVRAFAQLEDEGLGKTVMIEGSKGTQVRSQVFLEFAVLYYNDRM